MPNERDEEIEALQARVAELEKQRSETPIRVTLLPKGWFAKVILWGIVALIALLVIASVLGPHTVGEMASDEKQRCINEQGFGDWHGSDGMTLERYCEAYGDLRALEEDRREHPERY